MNLFAELRRRNVIRMAGLYLVGAWLILHVAETLLPIFRTPDWVLQALVVLLALGLLPMLAFSWLYELTPEGIRRDAEVPPELSRAPAIGRRMDRLILAGVVLLVVIMATDRIWVAKAPDGEPSGAVVAEAGAAPAGPPATDTPGLAVARGIGVLPFTNLSPDPDNAFFASGVHEEVLTHLSRIDALRVISRTSMEKIAGDGLDVAQIGQRLGVSHVLEGSVRRAGDQVRVTVQLIEAATDRHVWAENYDRTLDDVFAIQSQIALAIAGKLQVELSATQIAGINERPTSSPEAYDLFLRAAERMRSFNWRTGLVQMIAELESAIAIDPEFLRARVLLVHAYGAAFRDDDDLGGDLDGKAAAQLAQIVDRWPGDPLARVAQAYYDRLVSRDLEAALAGFQALAAERPNDAQILYEVSTTLKWLDRRAAFLSAARRVHALDPESQRAHAELLLALRRNGLGEEALALAEQGVTRFPDMPAARLHRALLLRDFRQDLQPMLDFGAEASRSAPALRPTWFAEVRFASGDRDGAIAWLAGGRGQLSGLEAARVDMLLADLLRLAGRDREAEAPARRAFDAVRGWIDQGRSPRDLEEAAWLAWAASSAALAGERTLAAAWMERAQSGRLRIPLQRYDVDSARSDMHRWLGDPDAAWAAIAGHAGAPWVLPKGELLAMQALYDARFGRSAAYRDAMAQLRAGSAP